MYDYRTSHGDQRAHVEHSCTMFIQVQGPLGRFVFKRDTHGQRDPPRLVQTQLFHAAQHVSDGAGGDGGRKAIVGDYDRMG